jgi:hypothetical protein
MSAHLIKVSIVDAASNCWKHVGPSNGLTQSSEAPQVTFRETRSVPLEAELYGPPGSL